MTSGTTTPCSRSVLVDATWQGQPRKLLVHANRNGFFYVLDRTDGKFLLGKQYVKNVTWASGLTAEGRPIVVPDMEPTRDGKRVCPSLDGASNWYSTSFNPSTNLYYVQTNDKCGIFTRTDMDWEAGKGFMAGSFGQRQSRRSEFCALSTFGQGRLCGSCRKPVPSIRGEVCSALPAES